MVMYSLQLYVIASLGIPAGPGGRLVLLDPVNRMIDEGTHHPFEAKYWLATSGPNSVPGKLWPWGGEASSTCA